ncbi:MAG: zinc-binding dehydrogenase [Caldilineaceae bacterium]
MDGQPFPGEPLACAMNVFARSGIGPGETVAVIGIGFLGALLTQLAVAAGARVIAISRRDFSLTVARNCGASVTIAMLDHWEIIEEVKALTDGNGCDCVIEAVGLQWPLDLAAELTRIRGRLIVAGYHQDGLRQSICSCGTGAVSMWSTHTSVSRPSIPRECRRRSMQF